MTHVSVVFLFGTKTSIQIAMGIDFEQKIQKKVYLLHFTSFTFLRSEEIRHALLLQEKRIDSFQMYSPMRKL